MLRKWKVPLGSEPCLLLVLVSLVQNLRSALTTLALPETTADSRLNCALHLFRSHFADTTHFTVLGNAPWVGHFLVATEVPVTFHQLPDDRLEVLNRYSDVVFVVLNDRGNHSSVQNVLSVLRKRSFYYARVVVWWHAGRTRDVRAAMDAARNLEIVRLAVVTGPSGPSGSSGAQRVFGYREDCEDGSSVVRAVLLGTCGQAGTLQVDRDLFADPERWNLRGCALRLCCIHMPPLYTISARPEGGSSMSGWSAPLALALGESLNGTLDVRRIYWKQDFEAEASNGTAWGVLANLLVDHCDVVFGAIYLTTDRYNLADFSPSSSPTCVSLAIPAGLGQEDNPFAVVYREFSPALWALLVTAGIVVIALLALSWWGVNKHPLQDATFFTLSVLLGHPYVVPASAGHVKILMGFWLMHCIVLTTAYQAMRHSMLAAPHSPSDINTLSELVQAGLTVVGKGEFLAMLKQNAQEEGNETLLALAEHSISMDGVLAREMVERLTRKRDVAFFHTSVSTAFWATTLEKNATQKLVHLIPDFCGAHMHDAHVVLRRGSRFTPAIVTHMHRASDIGLTHDFAKRLTIRPPGARSGHSPFSFAKLSAAFLLLLIGLGASALVFVIEISITALLRIVMSLESLSWK